MTERRYAMTRLHHGDYLLPSNDARTLWRIARGEEAAGDENERHVTVWQAWRWRGDFDGARLALIGEQIAEDVEDWDRWELVASWFDSRRQAAEWVLNA